MVYHFLRHNITQLELKQISVVGEKQKNQKKRKMFEKAFPRSSSLVGFFQFYSAYKIQFRKFTSSDTMKKCNKTWHG